MPTYQEMADKIIRTPQGGVDKNFNADEDVDLSDAVAKTEQDGLGKWKGITVQLYNFIIGEDRCPLAAMIRSSSDCACARIPKCQLLRNTRIHRRTHRSS